MTRDPSAIFIPEVEATRTSPVRPPTHGGIWVANHLDPRPAGRAAAIGRLPPATIPDRQPQRGGPVVPAVLRSDRCPRPLQSQPRAVPPGGRRRHRPIRLPPTLSGRQPGPVLTPVGGRALGP